MDEADQRQVRLRRSFTQLRDELTAQPSRASLAEDAASGAFEDAGPGRVFSRSLDHESTPPRSAIPVLRNRSSGNKKPSPSRTGTGNTAAASGTSSRRMSLPHANARAPDGFTEDRAPSPELNAADVSGVVVGTGNVRRDQSFFEWHREHHWLIHVEWASVLAILLYQFANYTADVSESHVPKPHFEELRAQLQEASEREEAARAHAARLADENERLNFRHRIQTAFDMAVVGAVIVTVVWSRRRTAAVAVDAGIGADGDNSGDNSSGAGRCDGIRRCLASSCRRDPASSGSMISMMLRTYQHWIGRVLGAFWIYALLIASESLSLYRFSIYSICTVLVLWSMRFSRAREPPDSADWALDIGSANQSSIFNRRGDRKHNTTSGFSAAPAPAPAPEPFASAASPPNSPPPQASGGGGDGRGGGGGGGGLGLLVTPPPRGGRTPRKPGLSATRQAVDAVLAARALSGFAHHNTPTRERAKKEPPAPKPATSHTEPDAVLGNGMEPEETGEAEIMSEVDEAVGDEEYEFSHDPQCAMLVVGADSRAQHMVATVAQFGLQTPRHIESKAVLCSPELADAPLLNASKLRGAIAVVKRGVSTFVEKSRRAQAAGASGVIIINTDDEPYVPMAGTPARGGTINGTDVSIPVICVRKSDGDSILDMLATSSSTNSSGTGDGADTVPVSFSYPGHGPSKALGAAAKSSGPPGDGTLTVTIVKCRGLLSVDKDRLSDPFVTLWLGGRQNGLQAGINRLRNGERANIVYFRASERTDMSVLRRHRSEACLEIPTVSVHRLPSNVGLADEV
eukprot:SAG22_NODE_163_length_16829_cov_9.946204_14_plen_799_part_00